MSETNYLVSFISWLSSHEIQQYLKEENVLKLFHMCSWSPSLLAWKYEICDCWNKLSTGSKNI